MYAKVTSWSFISGVSTTAKMCGTNGASQIQCRDQYIIQKDVRTQLDFRGGGYYSVYQCRQFDLLTALMNLGSFMFPRRVQSIRAAGVLVINVMCTSISVIGKIRLICNHDNSECLPFYFQTSVG